MARKEINPDISDCNVLVTLMDMKGPYRDGILGMAIADAFGVPYEYSLRREMCEKPCASEMIGHGTHDQEPGCWSDDTSMALAIADSLARNGSVVPDDIMHNFYLWLAQGAFTSKGNVFGMGGLAIRAIQKYMMGFDALSCGRTDVNSNGNGSLMRTLPISVWACLHASDDERKSCSFLKDVETVSSLTHAHPRSLIACGIYTLIIDELLHGGDDLLGKCERAYNRGLSFYLSRDGLFAEEAASGIFITPAQILASDENDIGSNGYVIDSLNAALLCLLSTNNYQDCVMKAVSLGGDTDTIACIAGGLAGILYGIENIPTQWLETLKNKPLIANILTRLITASQEA